MAPIGQCLCAITGLCAFPCAYQWSGVDLGVATLLFSNGLATVAQHLTEGDAPIVARLLSMDGESLKWIDRACAVGTALRIATTSMSNLSASEARVLVVALSIVIFCDTAPLSFWLLSSIHVVWHLAIFWWLWNRARRLRGVPRETSAGIVEASNHVELHGGI